MSKAKDKTRRPGGKTKADTAPATTEAPKAEAEATGSPIQRNGVVGEIKKLFDEGKGITEVTAMIEALDATELKGNYSPATVRTQVGKLRKAHGISGQGQNRNGVVAKIRELFGEGDGVTDVSAMEAALHDNGFEVGTFSIATVKTQVGKLRKAHGLTSERKNGVVAKIRELFADGSGTITVKEMVEALDATEFKDNYAIATVHTQVGLLRRQHGLTKPRGSSEEQAAAS